MAPGRHPPEDGCTRTGSRLARPISDEFSPNFRRGIIQLHFTRGKPPASDVAGAATLLVYARYDNPECCCATVTAPPRPKPNARPRAAALVGGAPDLPPLRPPPSSCLTARLCRTAGAGGTSAASARSSRFRASRATGARAHRAGDVVDAVDVDAVVMSLAGVPWLVPWLVPCNDGAGVQPRQANGWTLPVGHSGAF